MMLRILARLLLGPCRHAEFYWYEKPEPIGALTPVYCRGGDVWHLRAKN